MNSRGDRNCVAAGRSAVISCSKIAPETSPTTRTQTELPFGGAAKNSVNTPPVLRGESQEAVSRDLNVPVHRLAEWRDRVLMAAEGALKERERDARDDEIARLQAKVGEITMANELLYAKIDKLEGGRPLALRRSRT
jgi:transposase